MLSLRNFIVAGNTSQKSWDSGNKRLVKLHDNNMLCNSNMMPDLSEVKERLRWQIVNQFKKNVVNVKLQRICRFYCLQIIISLKDSENSLNTRDKTKKNNLG